jgi:hypothetical protein
VSALKGVSSYSPEAGSGKCRRVCAGGPFVTHLRHSSRIVNVAAFGHHAIAWAQSLMTTRLVSVPMLSIVTDTSSPSLSGPTPAGVPVSRTSPGSSVITWLT